MKIHHADRRAGSSSPMAKRLKNHAAEAAILLKALAHPVRLMVMCRLVERANAVSEIVNGCNLSASALSRHLAVLRAARLVRTRRQSRRIHYSLEKGPAVEVIKALYSSYCGEGRACHTRTEP
jgi:DNA-binding transcriptional ArsR family regulator